MFAPPIVTVPSCSNATAAHADRTAGPDSSTGEVREDATFVQCAGVTDRCTVSRSRAGDDTQTVEMRDARDPRTIHPDAGVGEEHSVDSGWDDAVRPPTRQRRV